MGVLRRPHPQCLRLTSLVEVVGLEPALREFTEWHLDPIRRSPNTYL